MLDKEDNTIVTIIVITYNSSKFVVDTLDSALNQTYKNIELIISDDCSTDSTIDICKIWLQGNNNRFVNTKLITSDKNTGIAPNCNRGIREAKGEWIKLIAGDDILYNDCIETNINEVNETNNYFYFSRFSVISEDKNLKNHIEDKYDKNYYLFNGNQFDNLMNFGYFFPTVTFFANRKELFKIGLFNEEFPFHEDFPMWFKILRNGYHFQFIDKYTVKYRIYNSSIYNNNTRIVNPLWHKSTKLFYHKEFFNECKKRNQYLKIIDIQTNLLYYDLSILFRNKPGILNNFCKLIFLMSPLYVKRKLICK